MAARRCWAWPALAGQQLLVHGVASAPRGVAILLGRGFAGQGLYAPVLPEERSPFFAVGGPLQHATSVGVQAGELVFMAGDFNCALSAADVLGGQEAAGARSVGAAAFIRKPCRGRLGDIGHPGDGERPGDTVLTYPWGYARNVTGTGPLLDAPS